MKTNSLAIASSLLSLALASPALEKKAACNADNCARAVTGTALPTATRSARLADCRSYQACTVTPAAGPTASARTSCPTALPDYAGKACTAPGAFASACSCAGVTRTTVTATATPTPTSTRPPQPPQCLSFDEVLDGPDQPVTYRQYFGGNAVTEDPQNPGNRQGPAPIRATYAGADSKCDAASQCAAFAAEANYLSFDLHFVNTGARQADGTWECVLYFDANSDPSYFDVTNRTIGAAYGYST